MTGRRADLAWADANLFISLIVGPEDSTHGLALSLFREVAVGRVALIVTPVTVHEVVNVLDRRYGHERSAIARELAGILQADGMLVPERAALLVALDLYGRQNRLDFADAYLAASASVVGPPLVASFDRDFDRVEGIRRIAS